MRWVTSSKPWTWRGRNAGPRTMEQYEDNLQALACSVSADDEMFVDRLVPPGEHTGWGFNDPNYPVRGRPAPSA